MEIRQACLIDTDPEYASGVAVVVGRTIVVSYALLIDQSSDDAAYLSCDDGSSGLDCSLCDVRYGIWVKTFSAPMQ